MKMNSLAYYRSMVGDKYNKIKKFKVLSKLLDYANKEFNSSIAVSWKEGKKTYQELNKDIAKTRFLLKSKGINKGMNIALIFKNDYNFVKTFFAVTTIGAIAVIIPPTLPKEILLESFNKFDIKAFVYGNEAEKNVIDFKGVYVPISYQELENISGESLANPLVKPADPAVIMFTGGTTGIPKGAILSHQALLRGSYNGCFTSGSVFNNTYMVLIPFFHVFGLVRNLLTSINTGSNVYLVKDPSQFINEVKIAKPNIMVLVPALANLIYDVVSQYGLEAVGGKLDTIIAGGAFVNQDLIKHLHEVNIKCLPGYGLTETANLVSGSVNYLDKPGSVGIVYPGQEVKLEGNEIYVKGDNLFSGYYNDPIETQEVLTSDGYFKTGDLGKFDKDGFLYIVGRSKNIIVLENGENVSPELIENALDNFPLINSSLVYEDKNNQGHAIIAAKIFPNYNVIKRTKINDIDSAIKEIVNKVNEKLPQYMNVNKVTILKEDFKRSGSMKIIRKVN